MNFNKRNDFLRKRLERQRERDYRQNDYSRNDYRNDYSRNSYNNSNNDYRNENSRSRDYRNDYSNYNDYRTYENDYHDIERIYNDDLQHWTDLLKKKDRFAMPYETIILQARNTGVNFQDFSEKEFYLTYLLMVNDYSSVSNDYNSYIKMAIDFLSGGGSQTSGSEKIAKYFYQIFMANDNGYF